MPFVAKQSDFGPASAAMNVSDEEDRKTIDALVNSFTQVSLHFKENLPSFFHNNPLTQGPCKELARIGFGRTCPSLASHSGIIHTQKGC